MKAYIFDLDGTLSDSIPLIMRTARRACDDLGLDISDDMIRAQIGVPLMETGELLLGPGQGRAYFDAYMAHYYDEDFSLQPFAGVAEMMDELKQRGAKLALATAKRRIAARESIRAIGVEEFLDTVVDCESTELHKPHPEPALAAAAGLGIAPAECMFIGDSSFDLLSGLSAGMRACGVTWGAGRREELQSVGPDYIVESVAELKVLLLSLLD